MGVLTRCTLDWPNWSMSSRSEMSQWEWSLALNELCQVRVDCVTLLFTVRGCHMMEIVYQLDGLRWPLDCWTEQWDCHRQYGTLVLTRLWYMVTSTRTIVVCSEWVDKLTPSVLAVSRVVFWYKMPSLRVIADASLYGLVLMCWVEDKSSVLHKLLWAKSLCDLECLWVEVLT